MDAGTTQAAVSSQTTPERRPFGGIVERRPGPRLPVSDGSIGARDPLIPLAVCLAAIAVFSKWLLLPFPVTTPLEFVRWVLRLSIVASADLCFVAAFTAVCGLVSLGVSRGPRIRPTWQLAQGALFVVAGWYALAGIAIFRITMVPLTIRLVAIAGHPSIMHSSIREYLSWSTCLAAVAVPAAFICAPRIATRLPLPRFAPSMRIPIVAVVLALVAMYGLVCQRYIAANWTDPNRWERRISHSPHGVLIISCVEELMKDALFTGSFMFAEVDTSDFTNNPPPVGDSSNPTSAMAAVEAERRAKNVVYIVIESLGVEYVNLYGSPHETMPRLARRAAENGVVFENAYVQAANSCKSLIALSCGVYPRPDWKLIVRDYLDFDVPMVADVLHAEGYRTSYMHSGRWSWKNRDRFLHTRAIDTLIDAGLLDGKPVSSWGVTDRSMFDAALDWIDEEPQRPFFLFTYTIETHHPYAMPEDEHDFGVDDPELYRYLNALRATDTNIDRFLTELDRRGLLNSTLVVITSDHGEGFGRHGRRMHNFDIYETSVHVPLVMLHPSLSEAGLETREPVICQHIDVPATVLDALGKKIPDVWQGRSLLADRSPRRAYFLATGNQIPLGLRDRQWKYHYYADNGREELFDLSDDPLEQVNLAPREPARCEQYRKRVGGLVRYQQDFLARHGAR